MCAAHYCLWLCDIAVATATIARLCEFHPPLGEIVQNYKTDRNLMLIDALENINNKFKISRQLYNLYYLKNERCERLFQLLIHFARLLHSYRSRICSALFCIKVIRRGEHAHSYCTNKIHELRIVQSTGGSLCTSSSPK